MGREGRQEYQGILGLGMNGTHETALTSEPKLAALGYWNNFDPNSPWAILKSLRYNTPRESWGKDFIQACCWRFRMPIILCPQLLKSIVYKYRTCKNQSSSYKNGSKCLITPIGQDSQATLTWKTKVGPQDQITSCFFSWTLRLILARTRSANGPESDFPGRL